MEQFKKRVFKKGAYIYVEGDETVDEIYIVERGIVQLKPSNDRIKRYKEFVRDGEVFGFISSLCQRPRMESTIAKTDSIIIIVSRSRFIDLVQKNPEIALKILKNFAEELRQYDEMMFSLQQGDTDIGSDELKIFDMGSYYFKTQNYPFASYILNRYMALYPAGIEAESASAMIREMEKAGDKGAPVPMKTGIYKVYHDKQIIFCESEPGEELYIIKEGKVKIVKFSNNTEIMLSVLREGDIFGELAIVSDNTRNASAVTWGKTVLLPIRKETLGVVLAKSPNIINKIFMAISQRIWFTHIRLEARVYVKPVTRIYAFLENKLMEDNISLKSSKPVTLNFGIDELLRMSGLTPSSKSKTMNHLLEDSNLVFHIGQTVIENPIALSAKAKFYRSRDHMTGQEGEEEAPPVSRAASPTLEFEQDLGLTEDYPADEIEDITLTPENEPGGKKPVREESDLPIPAPPSDKEFSLPSEEIPFDID